MSERTLDPGDRVGPYTVSGHLGTGGMGEVYRAHDPRLNRSLALKILPPDVNQDSVRRFMSEAQAASALNHPHILSIFEFGQATVKSGEEIYYIAMELVDGDTLRSLIVRRAPLQHLLAPLAQAADALARAHASGLVHRDLKPENVMVTHDGYAKVLDFGLAKLVGVPSGPRLTNDDDAATAVLTTQPGAVMGTVGYMSPEQILGRPLDARSDLFALGCILYEAASGKQPFAGQSGIDTLHRIVYDEPALLGDDVDASYRDLVRRCLAKKPEARVQSAREVADALRQLQRTSGSTGAIAAPPPRRRLFVPIAIAAICIAAGVAYTVVSLRDESTPQRIHLTRLTNHGRARVAAISGDGRYVAQVVSDNTEERIVLRHIGTGSETTIGKEEARSIAELAFAPGGDHIWFISAPQNTSDGTLFRLAVLGGTKERVLTGVTRGLAFASEKRIAFVQDDGRASRVIVMDLVSGTKKIVAALQAPLYAGDTAWIGDELAYVRGDRRAMHHDIAVIDPDSKRELWRAGLSWNYIRDFDALPNGDLIAAGVQEDGSRLALWRIDRDARTATKLTQDLSRYEQVSTTSDGTKIASVNTGRAMNLWIAELDGSSRQVTEGRGDYYGVDWWSPGQVVYASDAGGTWDVWELDLATSNAAALTRDARLDYFPTVSPDGTRIAFVSNLQRGPRNVWELDRRTRALRPVTTGTGENFPRYSPDGRSIAYTSYATGEFVPRLIDLASKRDVAIGKDLAAVAADLSPDGTLAAVIESGERWRLALVDLRTAEIRRLDLPVTLYEFGGVRWSGDGRALYFICREGTRSNVCTINADGTAPRQVTRFDSGHVEQFDLSPDGKRIVLIRGTPFSDAVLMTFE